MMSAWWTLAPTTGEPVQVLPAELVHIHSQQRVDAEVKADVMREAAARARLAARRVRAAIECGEGLGDDWNAMREAIDWIADGCPAAPAESRNEVS